MSGIGTREGSVERGGRRGRAASVRGRAERGGTRGGRGRGSRGAGNEVSHNFLVGYTTREGRGTLASTPKRPRLYRPPTSLTIEEPSCSGGGGNHAMVVDADTFQTDIPPEVVTAPPSPAANLTIEEPSCSGGGGNHAMVVDADTFQTDIPPEMEIAPPAPTAFETYGGSREEERYCLNYGSDEDSASDEDNNDDDETLRPMFVPRVDRIFFFNEDDDDDDDDRPSVQTPEPALPPSEPLQYGPKDLFHFDWVSYPSVPVAPEERRETFRAGEVGPLAVYQSPYEAFTAIWTPEFMQEIVVQTNKYAQEIKEQKIRDGSLRPDSRINRWHDTNVDELYVYFALILASGECIKGTTKEYWAKRKITITPGFSEYMSFNRMVLLNSCLHFADNTTDLRTLTTSQARIFKIKPVIQHLNDRFQTLYRLGRNIVIDESLTQLKGWLVFKQFIKNKAAGTGIKTIELCESQTGYLWKFEVFSRREDTEPERNVSGYIVNLVLDLLKGLEDKGFTVWMDNYYNSPALARVLKSLGFDCVGTLRTNRQGVPSQIQNLKKKDMAIGQMSGCTSGDVDILVWRDANRVPMISTYHGAGVRTSRGKSKPIVVHDYNVCMGGVDKKDQMLSSFPIERKRTRIWYKKFFRRLLNASVLNADIMHRDRVLTNTPPPIRKHRDFRQVLVDELLERHYKPARILTPRIAVNLRKPRVILPQDALQHFPREYGTLPNGNRIRHRCVLCHKRQYTFCPACNVPLCVNCIITYHSSS